MFEHLDPRSPTPLYAQIANRCRVAIAAGELHAGAALPSFIEKLPNGDGFQCATANYISQGGKPLEGLGVIPDVEAPPSRALLLEGRDAAIESAIHWIHTQ